jgi:WD40 repeat protein
MTIADACAPTRRRRSPLCAVFALCAFQEGVPGTATSLPARTIAEEALPIRDIVVEPKRSRIIELVDHCLLVARDARSGSLAWRTDVDGLKRLDLGRERLVATMGVSIVNTFDLETGKEGKGVGGADFASPATSIVSDPRDRWVWIGCDSGLQRIVPENVNGWSRRPLPNGGVTALALANDGELLAVGNRDGTIRFANNQSASIDKKKELRGHSGPVTALAFDSKVLFSVSEDRSVRAWSLGSGLERFANTEHASPIRSLALSPKLDLGASGDDEGTVNVWRTDKGQIVATWSSAGTGSVAALAFMEKENALIVAAGTRLSSLDLSVIER